MLIGLKAAILQRGLSQRETSRLSSVPENRLSSIINGWAAATSEEKRKLATVLKVSEDVLFDVGSSIEIRSNTR
jgi:plasmid maintenance system antidote protein VapI